MSPLLSTARCVDFNKDGYPDILFLRPSNQGDNHFSLSFYDPGQKRFSKPHEVLTHGAFNPAGVHLVDFNKDGYPDVLFQDTDNRFWLSFYDPVLKKFGSKEKVLEHGTPPFNPAGVRFLDFNKNGYPDVLYQGEDNRFWLSFYDPDHKTFLGPPSWS